MSHRLRRPITVVHHLRYSLTLLRLHPDHGRRLWSRAASYMNFMIQSRLLLPAPPPSARTPFHQVWAHLHLVRAGRSSSWRQGLHPSSHHLISQCLHPHQVQDPTRIYHRRTPLRLPPTPPLWRIQQWSVIPFRCNPNRFGSSLEAWLFFHPRFIITMSLYPLCCCDHSSIL
jgi:hypothetical protein